jgi:vacuolar-type H+-ATPase subunit H
METTQVTGTADAGTATPIEPTLTQTTPVEGAAAETPVEPKYVTEEVLEQKAAEIIRRMKQSDRDRMKQIDTKLSEIKSRMETDGAQLTPSQVNVLREQIEQEVPEIAPAGGFDTAGRTSAYSTTNPDMTPEMKVQADFVYAQLEATFADVGAAVTPNDPEWKEIKDVLDDPKGSLAKAIRTAGKAAEKKLERVAAQKNTASARALSGGQTQSTGEPVATNAHELWNTAFNK